LTQIQLARLAGLSSTTISLIENGANVGSFSMDRIVRALAAADDVEPIKIWQEIFQ
jgi:transcriptional regulator with XRE-family HTH domain